ncbi:MAG: hypothetical protein J5666_02070, partial [Bacilli bacterium]|nr:hypothetical protein [Bacilli bacterium]
AERYYEVYLLIQDHLKDNMQLTTASNSLAIRIIVPKLDFKEDFKAQERNLVICLNAVKELQDIIKELDFKKILELQDK